MGLKLGSYGKNHQNFLLLSKRVPPTLIASVRVAIGLLSSKPSKFTASPETPTTFAVLSKLSAKFPGTGRSVCGSHATLRFIAPRALSHLTWETWKTLRTLICSSAGGRKIYCNLCRWELFASKDAPDHATGYTNGRDWLCTECYDKFIARPDFFSSNYPDIT